MTDNKYKLYSCTTGWITLNLKYTYIACLICVYFVTLLITEYNRTIDIMINRKY